MILLILWVVMRNNNQHMQPFAHAEHMVNTQQMLSVNGVQNPGEVKGAVELT